jgi:hypothetical protein
MCRHSYASAGVERWKEAARRAAVREIDCGLIEGNYWTRLLDGYPVNERAFGKQRLEVLAGFGLCVKFAIEDVTIRVTAYRSQESSV